MYNSQQVYLPMIVGHVPTEMVQCISAFLDVCYIIHRADITTDTLQQFDIALAKFHQHCEVFRTTGVRPDGFNLPRQHAPSTTATSSRNLVPLGVSAPLLQNLAILLVSRSHGNDPIDLRPFSSCL